MASGHNRMSVARNAHEGATGDQLTWLRFARKDEATNKTPSVPELGFIARALISRLDALDDAKAHTSSRK